MGEGEAEPELSAVDEAPAIRAWEVPSTPVVATTKHASLEVARAKPVTATAKIGRKVDAAPF